MHILLKIYIIQILVGICINPLGMYIMSKLEGKYKRRCILDAILSVLLTFIPIISILQSLVFIGLGTEHIIKKWLHDDPTRTENNFQSFPKKEKKVCEPIINRSEILDL